MRVLMERTENVSVVSERRHRVVRCARARAAPWCDVMSCIWRLRMRGCDAESIRELCIAWVWRTVTCAM